MPALLRDDDVDHCLRVLRAGSKSFHAASLLLPTRMRAPAAVVYSFCRVSDDSVDQFEDAPERRREALRDLHARLDAAYDDAPRDSPVDRAFSKVALHYRIPKAIPTALLEGFAWDADGRTYDDLSSLLGYAARVASTVGVMMTLLMGPRDRDVLARAAELGCAMQLTNIARDVGEDARGGRLYLPAAWLREVGLDPASFLRAPRFSPALGRVTARLLANADELYTRSEAGIAALPLDCRASIAAARHLYAAIGDEIRKSDYDSVAQRAFTTGPTKARLVATRVLPSVLRRTGGLHRPALPEVRFLIDAVR